ncbi:hypothetical protein KAW18_16765 [candidate division WOR-3 bacterium]|nr:hypothetical protein [candidate division WOR-3 bacterium]
MKIILLNGHGIDMRVNSAKLHIKNGRTSTTEEPEEYDFCARSDQYRRAMGAGDKANVMLNYGYALLEAEC